MPQQHQRSQGIATRIMPAKSLTANFRLILQSQRPDHIPQGMGSQSGIDCPGKNQCIHPGAERVKRKNPQKAFLRGRSVRNHPAIRESRPDLRPQIHKPRGICHTLIRDSMHLPRRPCHRNPGLHIRIQRLPDPSPLQMDNRHLDGFVGASGSGTGTLKINGCKTCLRDPQERRSFSVDSQSRQASVIETPYLSWESEGATGWLPAWMWLSIIAPMISRRPPSRWARMLFHTSG